MLAYCYKLFRDEEGASAVEYALLIAVVALIAFVGAGLLGISLRSRYGGFAVEVAKVRN